MKTHQLWNVSFLNQIIETMADGLFTLDIRGQITSWNKAMERISGYSARDAVGKGCSLLECSKCYGNTCPADVNKCGVMEYGKTDARECSLRHKEGYEVPIIKNARLVKDDNGVILGVVETITDLTDLNAIKAKIEETQAQLKQSYRLGNIIGKSVVMQNVYAAIRAAAKSRATILVQGESGTGKELVAGAIHYKGMSADRPMVIVNCSALSETLLESELFGHVKGAFTGAHKDRQGRFEEADKGSIFLDEIGELTQYMQVKLLRVLQEREIERVGDSKKIKIDIRIIAATHQNLYDLVAKGKFREDLYYRLKVFPIHVPPLRDRREDIPLLVNHFIEKGNQREAKNIKGINSDALKKLMNYSFPGNIRELENAIEHAFVICDSDKINLSDLPVEIISNIRANPVAAEELPAISPQFSDVSINRSLDRETLMSLLEECDWNKAKVARRINKSRTSVWKYMKKWDIPLQP